MGERSPEIRGNRLESRELLRGYGGAMCLRDAVLLTDTPAYSGEEAERALETMEEAIIDSIPFGEGHVTRLSCGVDGCNAACILHTSRSEMTAKPFSEAADAATLDDCMLDQA